MNIVDSNEGILEGDQLDRAVQHKPAHQELSVSLLIYREFSRRGTHPVRTPSRAPCWIFLEQQNML